MRRNQAMSGVAFPPFEAFRNEKKRLPGGECAVAWIVTLTDGDRFFYRPTATGVPTRRYRSRSTSEDEVIRLMFHEQQLKYYCARQHLGREISRPPMLVQLPGEADEDESAVEALIAAEMGHVVSHRMH